MRRKSRSFRNILMTLLVAAVVADMALVGSTILALRVTALDRTSRRTVEAAALSLSKRVEGLLDSVAGKIDIISRASGSVGIDALSSILDRAVAGSSDIEAIYVLDPRGIVLAAGLREGREARKRELVGDDLSGTPLLKGLRKDGDVAWSDKYLSGASGGTTVGVGIRFGARTVIAEVPLAYLLETLKVAVGVGDASVMIVDRRGEVVADSGGIFKAGVDNVISIPAVKKAMEGSRPAERGTLGKTSYRIAAARSELLGWTFIAREPAGIDNPIVRATVLEIVALVAGTLVVGLILAPLWSRRVSAAVLALANQARAITAGRYGGQAVSTRVGEFRDLSRNMLAMSAAIREREAALAGLNAELEARVAERTRELERSNAELKDANESLRLTQSHLVRSEKLAALGKLVTGVAHELNTPLGNGLMAVSALRAELRDVGKGGAGSAASEDSASFMENCAAGLEIAERNLDRAARLVTSFKQVAVDQSSSQRRRFDLAEVTDEVLLTLKPSTRRLPYRLENEVPPGITMDSYPGVFGQILTNLINNAVLHAFEGRDRGLIRVAAREEGPDRVRFEVADDGIGIPEEHRKRIFEPFFTTKLGRGGTGLGLSIAHNAASDLLGGSLDFVSEAGKGTVFVLTMPKTAPRLQE